MQWIGYILGAAAVAVVSWICYQGVWAAVFVYYAARDQEQKQRDVEANKDK